ncbi:MAG: hypothetical protein ACR2HX_17665 [Pyrinomonadaceae bacterium]
MKRKESRREKEVSHRIEIDAAHRWYDQHENEREEQRKRGKKADRATGS